ncbi:putative toxin-antitoxin system toxin component, PIN family [Burkholderia ubonensis]|uniref:Twitching motility protein PilT n=1 Tax=Burkholderia ubonensis TaxID=101571 RepID=A0AAW3NHU6_9BURK|nr:putative toxin-antitoxin system toxin component, PIN family [Burkholderia ubonensis]KVT58254.1 twitching motility protein PilT [Burkholderia ubonensis]KVV42652.1 twitching motility protein PilT [Burkholderia ubonensis]KVW34300.1 twitching motility protein PilT [Burkholderia ubonensis]
MRVILDTNVLLGALISPSGPPDAIYRAWRAARFELITSVEQLDELRRVSRYPKLKIILPAHRIGTMINNMQRAIVLNTLPALPNGVETNDPNDRFLLAMALAGEADYLVTGDRRAGLLERGSIGRTRIATPVVFCDEAL